MTDRCDRSEVDVIVVLQRPNGHVLLLRRALGGRLALVAGPLLAGEAVRAGAVRKVGEEIGVEVATGDLEFCHLADHLRPDGVPRLGVVFTAQRWAGEPFNAAPHRHTGLVWARPGTPPADCGTATGALLRRFSGGELYSEHGWPITLDGGHR
ncbi:NUDIX domain-containing protein [Streptomyces sp. NPDC051940]|uniref:NUDIX domain-containing protein n=1 Tax=Streptomyces sp. NPDC051940 TaxID=3155675 RepID=UPI00342C2B1E